MAMDDGVVFQSELYICICFIVDKLFEVLGVDSCDDVDPRGMFGLKIIFLEF